MIKREMEIFWSSFVKTVFPIIIYLYYLGPNIPGKGYTLSTLLMYLAGIGIVLFHWKKVLWLLRLDPILVAMLLVDCLSIGWSLHPGETLDSVRSLILITIMGIYLVLNYSIVQQLRFFALSLGLSTVLSLIVILIPSYSFRGLNFQGIFPHKNRLSNVMAMTIFTFTNLCYYYRLNKIFRHKWFRLLAILIAFTALFLMLKAGSKGSYPVLALTLALMPIFSGILKKSYKGKLLYFLSWIYLFFFLTLFIGVGFNFIVVDLLGKDPTLNGRTELWDYLIQRGMTRPWLGFGVGAFWTDTQEGLMVFTNFDWMTGAITGNGNSHSGYIDVFLNRGLLGLSLSIVYFASLLFRVGKKLFLTGKWEYFWAIQWLFFAASVSFYEDMTAFPGRNVAWLIFISISLSISLENYSAAENRILTRMQCGYLR